MDHPQEITMPNALTYQPGRYDLAQSPTPMTGTFLLSEKEKGFPSMPVPNAKVAVGSGSSFEDEQNLGPAPKYSRRWFRNYWDLAIKKGILPRVVYTTIGISLIAIWVGITIHFTTEQVVWNEIQRQAFTQILEGNKGDLNGGVGLEGSLNKFDPATRQLSISWTGIHQDYGTHKVHKLLEEKKARAHWPLAIYKDVSTKLYMKQNATDTTPNDFAYKLDNASAPHIGAIGMHVWDTFTTEIGLQQASDEASIMTQPLVSYPWDEWAGEVIFVANDINGTNVTLTRDGNVTIGNITPLVGARLIGTALNWRFNLTFENPCPQKPEEISERFTTVNEPGDYWLLKNKESLDIVRVPCYLKVRITASRPPLVKFAVIMSLIVNWTSTFFIFILTCESLIMRRGFMLSGTDLMSVTFTSLFALPSIRLLLPGAPEFGCLIDLVGIIPNVIMISLCICAIAISKLNRHKKNEKTQ